MPEITIGLAPRKASYFDPLTNTYLTANKSVQAITYTDYKQLKNITHALFASVPALVLYKGQIPQEAIDEWEAKYTKMFRSPTTKNIVENGKVIGTKVIADPLRNGMDYQGRPIEPNRAFDRPDKVNDASDTSGANVGEAEEVTFSTESVDAKTEEAQTKGAKRNKQKQTPQAGE